MDVVDDVGIEQHAVAVGEGEHRVEMHGGAQLRHGRDDDPLGRALLEQRRRELADRLARGPLAHADQDDCPCRSASRRRPRASPGPWSSVGSPHQTLTLPAKSGWNL